MEHIGSLMATMGIDISDFDKKIKDAKKSLNDVSKGISNILGNTEKEVKKAYSNIAKEQKELNNEFIKLEKGVKELNTGLINNTQFLQRYGKALSAVKTEVRNTYGENKKYTKSLDDVATATAIATKRQEQLIAKQNRLNGVFKTIRAAAIGYATVLATMEISQFISSTVKAGIEVDTLRRSFTAITSSSLLARDEIAFVTETANLLGLELGSLQKSYKNILAASKGTALEGEGVRKVFLAINKASAVLGLSVDDTEGSLRALSQMISKGNVQAEELRGQLGERLPGAFSIAAAAMGVSTQRLNDMLKNGEVLADDLLPKLADYLENRFASSVEDASNRATASFNRMKNAATLFGQAIGDAGLTDFMADLAKAATVILNAATKLITSSTIINKEMTKTDSQLSMLKAITKGWGSAAEASGTYKKAIERNTQEQYNLAKAIDDTYDLDAGLDYYNQLADIQKKINVELAKLSGDKIEADRLKAIDSAKKKYKALLDLANEYLLDTTNIEKQLQNAIDTINAEALKKRNKETRKALDKIIADRDKAHKTLLKQQEKYREDISEYLDTYNLSDYDKKLYYLEKEVQAFKEVGLQEIDYAGYIAAKKQEIDNDYYEKQQKEADKLAKIQQDAYDDLYKTMKGYTRDVIDDFDNMGDTLVGLAKNIVKDIAAAFLTQNIVMPITLSAGSALGLTGSNGVPYADMTGMSSGNILSLGSSAWNAFSGTTSSTVGSVLGSGLIGSAGSSLFGSAWGTYGAVEAGTGSIASSGIVGALSTAAPYLAIAAAALPIISSFFESEPEPRIGIRKGNISDFGYNPTTKDMSNQGPINEYIVEYFDSYFSAIDELTSNAVRDVLSSTDWERIRVHPEDFDTVEDAIFAVSDDVFNKFAEGFIAGLADGKLSGIIDAGFFESIQADGESLLDTFINFGVVVKDTDDFIGQFTRQIDDFGESTKSAYENVVVITDIIGQVGYGVSSITDVSSITNINALTDSWHEMIDTLESVNATVGQITTAQTGMAQVLGANITGLTANALQTALMQGGDINSIIESSIQSAAYAEIAQTIAEKYITGINEEIGKVWIESDGDISDVVEAMQELDTSEVQNEIYELQEAFGLLAESASDIEDTAEAMRIVTLAIEGQLTTSQKFEKWQIDNIEAMNLFSEIVADSVTASELEDAVDAFADLGIEGADLNNVIGDLANRFTAASDDLVASLSSITSAQRNLSSTLGEETAAETLESLQSRFKNFQSWSEILGSETVTKQVRVDPTTADYENLVNELFNTMFGRDAASAGLDYWVGALKDASDGVDYTNIMQSMLDGAKASAKSGNLLSAKDLLYYAAAQPTIKEVNPLEPTYEEQTSTVSGSISSELESSIYDTIDALEALPELVTNGVVNESNITDWVDVISNANNEALNRLFGEDSETMINSLANAIDDYNAITETASDTTNSLTKAIDNTKELMDDYIFYLETEIDTRQDALDSATSVLEDYIEGEEALIDARKAASDDINDFINDLYGSTSSPVQSLEFFEKRYSQLLQEAKNSDADGVGDAVSNLTSFAREYLDFAGSYGGGDNYNDLFNSVVGDLSGFGNLQNRTAMAQSRDLKEVSDLLVDSNDELIDINEAIQEFRDAELAVDDNVWMTEELEKLGAIEDNLSLLLEAQTAYYSKIGEDVPDSARFKATGDNILQGTIDELGIDLNGLVFGTLSARLQQSIDAGTYSDLFASMVMSSSISQIAQSGIGLSDLISTIGNVSDDYQFAEGGIISGPMSGYQMPSATFHGTEAIIPLSNGSVPVQIQTPQNVNVQVFIDGKEVKSSVIKTIRTDPEAHTQIRRVANG